MKKIFAILISLLFVASVFGVASLSANGACHCDGNDIIIPANVQVGDTFISKDKCGVIVSVVGGGNVSDYIQGIENLPPEGDYSNVNRLKAKKPGTLKICPLGCSETNCKTLTITPKEYPIFSFMKLLGFGKKK